MDKNQYRSRGRYRYPPIDRAEITRVNEKAGKYAGRALLFSFISIFLHTTNISSSEISIFGFKFPVQSQYTLKGGICFLTLYNAVLCYGCVIEGAINGLFRTNRAVLRFFLAATHNTTRAKFEEFGLKSVREIKIKKKISIQYQYLVFSPLILLYVFSFFIILFGTIISLDDLFWMIIDLLPISLS